MSINLDLKKKDTVPIWSCEWIGIIEKYADLNQHIA